MLPIFDENSCLIVYNHKRNKTELTLHEAWHNCNNVTHLVNSVQT